MAIIKCKECGKDLSDTAQACPHCGAKLKQSSPATILLISAIVIFGSVALLSNPPQHTSLDTSKNKCSFNNIDIVKFKAGFVDNCRASSCFFLQGVATVNNKCFMPIGEKLKLIGYDKNNNPISVRDFWPASTNNLPVGESIHSLDTLLDYDKNIKSFTLEPISTKEW